MESVDGDISESQQTIEKAKAEIPIFHTPAMKTALASKFGRVSPSMKPVILRALYRELTNDASAPTNLHEAEINARLMRDLRHLNSRTKTCYDVF